MGQKAAPKKALSEAVQAAPKLLKTVFIKLKKVDSASSFETYGP